MVILLSCDYSPSIALTSLVKVLWSFQGDKRRLAMSLFLRPSSSRSTSPALNITDVLNSDMLNLDELDSSDDELPDTITGTQVKKEQISTPVAFSSQFTDRQGLRSTSPICLISDEEEAIVPSKPAPADSVDHIMDVEPERREDSDMEDMYADPPEQAPKPGTSQDYEDSQKAPGTSEEPNEQNSSNHLEQDHDHSPDRSSGDRAPSAPSQEQAKSTEVSQPSIVPNVSEPSSGSDTISGTNSVPPAPPITSAASQPPPSTPLPKPQTRHRELTDVFNSASASDKRKRQQDLPMLSLSQPLPKTSHSTSKTNPFKKPHQPRSSLSHSSQAFAESISRASPQKRSTQPPSSAPARKVQLDDDVEVLDDADQRRYTKRSRTAASFSPSETIRPSPVLEFKGSKHPEYWLLDGSVVIHMQGVLFKLHRSTLVNKSVYFKRMMAESAILDDRIRQYDVPDVSVLDFERLLKALDSGVSYVFNPPPFRVLASILRASRKLEFTKEYEFASRSLLEMWPSSLSRLTTNTIPNAAATVLVARECCMPEVLKRAYYELLRTGGLGQDVEEDADETYEDVENRTISREDLVRLITTRERLHLEWYLIADCPPNRGILPCPLASLSSEDAEDSAALEARDSCASATQKALECWDEHVKKSGLFEECMYDPLCGLERLSKVDWEGLGYCDGCVTSWRDDWMRKREKLWQNLDLWLGLTSSS
ncbi:unnamed protein product [Somion occarium]